MQALAENSFQKVLCPRSAVTELRLPAPDLTAPIEVLDPCRLSRYFSLAISAAWITTVSMSLKTWHWLTSYPRQFATLFPAPNQYAAVSVRMQLTESSAKEQLQGVKHFTEGTFTKAPFKDRVHIE